MVPFPIESAKASDAAPPLSILMVGLEWFTDNPGGGGRYLTDVATGLAARGHRITVLVPRQSDAHAPHEILDDVHVYRFPLSGRGARIVQPMRAVERLLAERGPFDVVHSHFALHGLGPLWHPRLAHARRVCQFQGPWAAESVVEGEGGLKPRIKYAIERLAYARCDRFIVLSSGFKDVLARDYGVPGARVRVIPAAVDLDRFTPAADREALRRDLGLGPGPVLFVMRRLVRRMGLEVMLDAFARVHAEVPEARLLMAGTGPLEAELSARIDQLGLGGAARLLGRVSDADLVRYYQAADLTVVPTVALEGFGLITVESLACGTPVIGTSQGGTGEILGPLEPRMLVPPGDAEALARRLLEFLQAPGAFPPREACRAYALAHYRWAHVLDQVESVLAGAD